MGTQQLTPQRYGAPSMSSLQSSDAVSGRAGWALAQSKFGSSVDPIPTRGADYALHTTACPPGFENPTTSLQSNKSIGRALSNNYLNNYQFKSNLFDTTKSKSFPANKKRSRSSKNETKIPRTNTSNKSPMESIYPEYWPDQRGKDGHLCCYYVW